MYTLAPKMYILAPKMEKIYLLKMYSLSDSFCTFFSESVYACQALKQKKVVHMTYSVFWSQIKSLMH